MYQTRMKRFHLCWVDTTHTAHSVSLGPSITGNRKRTITHIASRFTFLTHTHRRYQWTASFNFLSQTCKLKRREYLERRQVSHIRTENWIIQYLSISMVDRFKFQTDVSYSTLYLHLRLILRCANALLTYV